MICFSSKLPVLQVGTYQLFDYETSWLLRSIEGGLSSVQIEDQGIAQDIYHGVVYYLENECPWKPLKIEVLYEKMDGLFVKIGFPKVKGQIPMYCPEIRISVLNKLESLDCKIEIALFSALQAELESLVSYGAEKIILDDLIETVHTLIPSKKWSKECQDLHDELFSYQEKFNDPFRRENHFLNTKNRAH